MFRGKLRQILIGLALVTTLVAGPSSALLVQPIYVDMRYTGARSNSALRVINDRNRPIMVEVTVSRLDIPEEGAPVYTPIDSDDFLIFPAVATIPANGVQMFRVRWVGDVPPEGKLFALTSSELPGEIQDGDAAAVQLLYAIQSVVAIGPEDARPEIKAVGVERAVGPENAPGVSILFENEGRLHGQVAQATIMLKSGDWSRRLEPTDMSNAVGLGVIPAGQKRKLFVPVTGVPEAGALSVSADIPAVR